MKNIILFVILCLTTNYFVVKAQSESKTIATLPNYSFTDFKGSTYKVSDFKDKYIYLTFISLWADTTEVGNHLKFYDKVAKTKPNWIFVNIIWSNYDAITSSSIDNDFINWNKIVKDYNLKSESVICLYEDKSKQKIGFSKVRLEKDFFWSSFYIDKKGKEVRNRLNDWGKDATEENIKEFKRMNLFGRTMQMPRKPRK